MAVPDDWNSADELVEARSKFVSDSLAQIEEAVDRADRARAPLLAASENMAKLIVSLSSGAIVTTITLVQFLQGKEHSAFIAPGALKLSWVAFALADLLGLLRYPAAGKSAATRLAYEMTAENIRTVTPDLTDDEIRSGPADLVGEALTVIHEAIDPKISLRLKIEFVMFASFMVGMAALIVFAFANFPT